MRRPTLWFLAAAAALLGSIPASHAQSAYSYPWCARYPRDIGGYACYYTSFEQCMTTMRGIGGYCIRSPFYRGPDQRKKPYGRYT
jgi:hypothetical protein